MARRTAPPAAAVKVRDRRRADPLGGKIGAEAFPDITRMQSVYVDGSVCVGFIFERGRQGFEAFDADTRSLGLFPTQKAAADAVERAATLPIVEAAR